MPKLKATRNGTCVHLPKYSNAEMLMLEFFRGQTVSIIPKALDTEKTHINVNIYMHVDILDELINYINLNI